MSLTGKRSGKLVALRPAGKSEGGDSLWLCQCDCGKTKVIRGHNLSTTRRTPHGPGRIGEQAALDWREASNLPKRCPVMSIFGGLLRRQPQLLLRERVPLVPYAQFARLPKSKAFCTEFVRRAELMHRITSWRANTR